MRRRGFSIDMSAFLKLFLINLLFSFVSSIGQGGAFAFIRSFGLILVQGVITLILFGVFFGFIGFLVYQGYKSDSEFLDGIWVKWISRPLELVSGKANGALPT